MSEFMMTGLRLTQEGVSEDEFRGRFGRFIHEVYEKEIEGLLKLGLIESHMHAGGRPLLWRIQARPPVGK